MNRFYLCAFVLISCSRLSQATVLDLPSGDVRLVEPQKPIESEVIVPPIDEREAKAGGEWRGILSVDVLGTVDGKAGAVMIEAVDSEGNVVASQSAKTTGAADFDQKALWTVRADCEERDGRAAMAVDGNADTIWHSKWQGGAVKHPHWLEIDFGRVAKLEGIGYLPRQSGTANGTILKYRVSVMETEGGEWRSAAEGTFEYGEGWRDRQTVNFESAVSARAVRLESLTAVQGSDFGSAAELVPLGAEFAPKDQAEKKADAPARRLWLEISPEQMAKGKFALRMRAAAGGTVVLGKVNFCRVNSEPSSRIFGRSNGGQGPDQLGVGALGFDAMTEHLQYVLTVMTVRKDSPAEKAGLLRGDAIVAVNRRPLPVNDLDPGWEWLAHSHEAVLGRAIEDAFSPGRKAEFQKVVELSVLRDGKVEPISMTLDQPGLLKGGSFPNDATGEALHQEMIGFLLRTQRDDGSWSGAPIQTTMAALALLATHDSAHAERIKKAVDWMLGRYPEAEDFGNLGYWFCGYAGILYSEYYLATGDARVLPRLGPMTDWALTGVHTSKWNSKTLGHGPSGLPYDQKSLVAPSIHLLVFESLAKRCGLESRVWETLLPYMISAWSDPAEGGHGAMGYNASYKDLGEFWSRSGLFSMACHLRNERLDMRDAMIKIMRERHPWIRNSHAYGEPGGAWGLLALNLVDPAAFREVMDAYRWWFHLAWESGYGLRFTTPHMGAPYMGEDELINACYALVFAAPKRTIHLTGGTERNWLDVSAFETALTPVQIKRDRNGDVHLACRVPGPEIRYTTDGTEPQADSAKFEKAFPLKGAALVKARAFDAKGAAGEIAEHRFTESKSAWKIVAASGQIEALEKAAYAIDESDTHTWITDIGQDASGYPHYIVIDLGQKRDIEKVTLRMMHEATSPGKYSLKIGDDVAKLGSVMEGEWTKFEPVCEIKLPMAAGTRYVRLDFETPLKADSIGLVIREIDVE